MRPENICPKCSEPMERLDAPRTCGFTIPWTRIHVEILVDGIGGYEYVCPACIQAWEQELIDRAGAADYIGRLEAQLEQVKRERESRPEVVCICGSTRFADTHAIIRWELEKQGKIVLMINYLPHWYAEEQGWNGHDHFGEAAGLKDHLDELHLRKIDISDRVFVVNVDGYIGESTRNEIEYAEATGKPVQYLEPIEQAREALK